MFCFVAVTLIVLPCFAPGFRQNTLTRPVLPLFRPTLLFLPPLSLPSLSPSLLFLYQVTRCSGCCMAEGNSTFLMESLCPSTLATASLFQRASRMLSMANFTDLPLCLCSGLRLTTTTTSSPPRAARAFRKRWSRSLA